jgi:hypothetical protein
MITPCNPQRPMSFGIHHCPAGGAARNVLALLARALPSPCANEGGGVVTEDGVHRV